MIAHRIVLALGLLALPRIAAAADARQVVAILPPVTDNEEARRLALLVQARASALLVEGGQYHDVHVKMILSMLERDGLAWKVLDDPAQALRAGKRLGAGRVVHAILVGTPEGWTMRATTRRSLKDFRRASISVPWDASRVVAEGGLALAEMVIGADKLAVPPSLRRRAPATTSHLAALAYARCYAPLIEQPFRVGKPVVLSEQQIAAARQGCEEAVKQDPEYAEAWAALGLLHAVAGQDGPAVDALARVKPDAGYLPFYWLARYWLVLRYQSSEAGTRVLAEAIRRYPGFLLARGYLAQHLATLEQHAEALAAWRAYEQLNPQSAFIAGEISHALARLGRHDQAIAAARRATALDPESRDAALELASRYVDAGRPREAIDLLTPLARQSPPHGEVLLRLGYAHLLAGNLAEAEPHLERAITVASGAREWRTRARARFDLAKIAARRGKEERAILLLRTAASEGYDVRARAARDPDLGKLGDKLPAQGRAPREASPLPVTADGEVDTKAPRRPTPPPGFDALKV